MPKFSTTDTMPYQVQAIFYYSSSAGILRFGHGSKNGLQKPYEIYLDSVSKYQVREGGFRKRGREEVSQNFFLILARLLTFIVFLEVNF
jgi:hypothetical protein